LPDAAHWLFCNRNCSPEATFAWCCLCAFCRCEVSHTALKLLPPSMQVLISCLLAALPAALCRAWLTAGGLAAPPSARIITPSFFTSSCPYFQLHSLLLSAVQCMEHPMDVMLFCVCCLGQARLQAPMISTTLGQCCTLSCTARTHAARCVAAIGCALARLIAARNMAVAGQQLISLQPYLVQLFYR
jgi:hypothetical protein